MASLTDVASSANFHALAQRALGFSSTKNITCARPLQDETPEPLFGKTTFHQLTIYISFPCLVLTILSCVILSWRHLHRWTCPQEQRQILRIVNLPAFYCLFNFLAVVFLKQAYQEIQPWAGLFEAFAVAALFLLQQEYVAPDGTNREKYFDQLPNMVSKDRIEPGGSWLWYITTYGSVMQYPLSKTIFVVIQVITQDAHVYCENSFSPKYAHLYLFLADILLIGGALGACLRFGRRLSLETDPRHKAKAKRLSFIGIVAFQILQDIIFSVLNGKLFSPSEKVTYNDINFGIPSLMTCIEAIVFSIIFHFTFPSGEYAEGERQDRYGLGPVRRQSTFKAIFDAMNVTDIVMAVLQAFTYIFTRYRARVSGQQLHREQTFKPDGSQTGLEPLTGGGRMRGHPVETSYDQPPSPSYEQPTAYGGPALPAAAQDPNLGGRAQTFRADNLRPDMYRPAVGSGYTQLSRSRSPSPEQLPRNMV